MKDNETLITVKGGEHCGRLYWPLIAIPASLDAEAPLYYEREMKSICDSNNDISGAVTDISGVLIRNYPVYIAEVWEESQPGLVKYAEDVEKLFNDNCLSEKLEKLTGETLKSDFYASFCCSISGGAEAIDITENQDIFGIGRTYEWAVKFISHEFVIYLLKQALSETAAFRDMLKYWPCTEGLAEFYISLIIGRTGSFTKLQHIIDFYSEMYDRGKNLSAPELFNMAAEKFA